MLTVKITDPTAARHVLSAFAHGIIGTAGANGVVPRFVEVDGLAGFLRPTLHHDIFELWPNQDDLTGTPWVFNVTECGEVTVR